MNPNRLFLSIIIPIYNTEKYLQECLDSCINQGFSPDEYEIICINDGSTDNSSAILSDYEKKHNNIVIVNQSNKGLPTARNRGIEIAKGKYIWFVDSDDFINDGFVKELYEKYYLADYDMVLFGRYHLGEAFSADETEMYKSGKLCPNHSIQTVCVTSRLFKTDFLKEHSFYFHEKVLNGEDALLDYIVYTKNPKVAVFDKLGYFYRIRSGSIMRDRSYEKKIRYIDSHITAIETVKELYDKDNKKRFRAIRYILDEVQYILDVIASIPFDKAKAEIQKLQKIDVLPFKKFDGFNLKDFIVTLYTNIMCCIYSILIRTSTHKIGFSLLKCESKLMKGGMMKKVMRFFKKKYSNLSKD